MLLLRIHDLAVEHPKTAIALALAFDLMVMVAYALFVAS
jgi:hypothetical protein